MARGLRLWTRVWNMTSCLVCRVSKRGCRQTECSCFYWYNNNPLYHQLLNGVVILFIILITYLVSRFKIPTTFPHMIDKNKYQKQSWILNKAVNLLDKKPGGHCWGCLTVSHPHLVNRCNSAHVVPYLFQLSVQYLYGSYIDLTRMTGHQDCGPSKGGLVPHAPFYGIYLAPLLIIVDNNWSWKEIQNVHINPFKHDRFRRCRTFVVDFPKSLDCMSYANTAD